MKFTEKIEKELITVMNCDVDYVNKPEKYKCLGNTIDGSIFNKHNDQEKKTLVKRIFFTCMEFIQFKLKLNRELN
jgi:translation elongation factor EF-Ts